MKSSTRIGCMLLCRTLERRARQLSLTNLAVAKALGYPHEQSISNIFRGRQYPPTDERRFFILARLLQIEPATLYQLYQIGRLIDDRLPRLVDDLRARTVLPDLGPADGAVDGELPALDRRDGAGAGGALRITRRFDAKRVSENMWQIAKSGITDELAGDPDVPVPRALARVQVSEAVIDTIVDRLVDKMVKLGQQRHNSGSTP